MSKATHWVRLDRRSMGTDYDKELPFNSEREAHAYIDRLVAGGHAPSYITMGTYGPKPPKPGASHANGVLTIRTHDGEQYQFPHPGAAPAYVVVRPTKDGVTYTAHPDQDAAYVDIFNQEEGQTGAPHLFQVKRR